MDKITVNIFRPLSKVSVAVRSQLAVSADMGVAKIVDRLPYIGSYTVTPSDDEQILETEGLRMTNNVVINPIPSNYGKITWNGSVLTVS